MASIASIVILLIMAGCAVAQYLKGSLVKSFRDFNFGVMRELCGVVVV